VDADLSLEVANTNNINANVYGAVVGSFDERSTQRQMAADLWTKPISLSQ